MNFSEAIKSTFSQYCSISTRAPRSQLWYWVLFTFLLGIASSVLDILVFHVSAKDHHVIRPFHTATLLFIMIPGICLNIRRLQDGNRSGWWLLLVFTIIGIIPLVYWLYFQKGTDGENRFGEDPLTKQVN